MKHLSHLTRASAGSIEGSNRRVSRVLQGAGLQVNFIVLSPDALGACRGIVANDLQLINLVLR